MKIKLFSICVVTIALLWANISLLQASENESSVKELNTFSRYYSTCDNMYRNTNIAGGYLSYGCDTSGVDEIFSYYHRSGTDDYQAYVKSGSSSAKYGPEKAYGEESKVQDYFNVSGDKIFGIDD